MMGDSKGRLLLAGGLERIRRVLRRLIALTIVIGDQGTGSQLP